MNATVRRAALAAALAVAMVCLGAAAWVRHVRAEPILHTTTVTRSAHPPVIAEDCPNRGVKTPCTFALADTRAVETVLTYFRSARVIDSYAYEPPTATVRPPVEETIRVKTTAGVVVSVLARCIANGGVVHDSQSVAPPTGPAMVSIVDGREPGCSVAVVLDVPAHIVVPLELCVALAHDSRIAVAG